MGYITTISFYNDGADTLTKHSEDLARKIDLATKGVQRNRGYDYDSLGAHANLMTLQKPRHADDHTLYLHAGNSVKDIYDVYDNPEKNQFYVDAFIREMEYHLKKLKQLKKDISVEK